MSKDEMDAHLSNYLINSWSFSKIATFARNEKAFEMSYIYGIYSKKSATTVSGEAYHYALEYYFTRLKEGEKLDMAALEMLAYNLIDEVKVTDWKLQKTTPTVEDCKLKASSTVTTLLKNFLGEVATYEEDVAEILDVEVFCSEFLTINGVDIPMPCHSKIDLVVKTKSGSIAIIDHKSKTSYTPEDEIALAIGRQAITYIKSYEAKIGKQVDEVWFFENKISENRDKSPQIYPFKIVVDQNARRLYEALLYEPLRRMISAVNDPDYIYLINDNDNFVDRAELYDFWARTMICEVEDFNVEESKKALVSKRLKKIRDSSLVAASPSIIKNFRENASTFIQYDLSNSNMTTEDKIEHLLRTFGILVRVAHKFEGYSSNSYLLEISAGVKISSIFGRRLDIANILNVANVRISNELIVYKEKSYLAIEFSKQRDKNLNFDREALVKRRIPIGKDNFDNTVVWDLENNSTPHMLICGATGSGKSVSIRSTIQYAQLAKVKNIIILDPKYEFTEYNSNNITVVNEIEQIENTMAKLVYEMNEAVKNRSKVDVLIVFDEFADALASARKGNELKVYEDVSVGVYSNGSPKYKRECVDELKSLEENLRILLQKGRSVGFRIVAATQRASVKVITGDAKVNFPVQVCFRVPKETDSRVVIDEAGAESLAGAGDGLMKSPEYLGVVRFQAYLS
jgi:hypothetical protein